MSKEEWRLTPITPIQHPNEPIPRSPMPADDLFVMGKDEGRTWHEINQESFEDVAGVHGGEKIAKALYMVNDILRNVADVEGFDDDVPFVPGGHRDQTIGGRFKLPRQEGAIVSQAFVDVARLTSSMPYMDTTSENENFSGRFTVGHGSVITDYKTGQQAGVLYGPGVYTSLDTYDLRWFGEDPQRKADFEAELVTDFKSHIEIIKNGPAILRGRRQK
jgi:hypothetical protein